MYIGINKINQIVHNFYCGNKANAQPSQYDCEDINNDAKQSFSCFAQPYEVGRIIITR